MPRILRSIRQPPRGVVAWDEMWAGADRGLVACWERGRAIAQAAPEVARRAQAGELIPLGWKGGFERRLKNAHAIGTLFYLAQWRGIRGEDLDLDWEEEVTLVCTVTGMTVTYTGDYDKYAKA